MVLILVPMTMFVTFLLFFKALDAIVSTLQMTDPIFMVFGIVTFAVFFLEIPR